MKSVSNHAFRWALLVTFGAVFAACGDDPEMMEAPIGTSGTGAGMVAPSAAGMPAAGGGAAGRAAAGSGTAGMTSGVAGSATAGRGAAGMTGMPGAGAGAGGAAGAGTAGAPPAMAAGSGGAVAGAGAGGAAGAAAGSGGGGAGGAAAGSGGGGAGGTGGAAATFTQVYGLIMTGCSCHVNGSAGGLGMGNKNTAYTNLVNANSGACSGQKRVLPGDAANSVLVHSLDRTSLGNCKVPTMPAGQSKWSDASIQTVKSWILAGAQNN